MKKKEDDFEDVHFPPPTEYFTVKSGQEIDLAPGIAMIFMRKYFFLYFFGLSKGGPDSWTPLDSLLK